MNEKNNLYQRLTTELALPEVQVVDRHLEKDILVLDTVPAMRTRVCPYCRLAQIKPLNRFTRSFWDASPLGDGEIIQIRHSFHRYQCRIQECGRVFSDPMSFVRPRAQVTLRFERFAFNYILLNNASLEDVSQLTGSSLTRQAVRKIFDRYIQEQLESNPDFLEKYYSNHYMDLIFSTNWNRLRRSYLL